MEVEETPNNSTEQSHWLPLKEALQAYRASVGNPSYGSIAERVVAARVENGMDPYAARVGRTTVYDAFQTTQKRVNLALIREIGWALGASVEQVEEWVQSCHKPVDIAVEEAPEPEPIPNPTWKQALLLAVCCLALNQFGIWLTGYLPIELFLDMIGTAIASMALGPWRGASVGYATAVLTWLFGHGAASLAFGLVQVLGALLWGYGVRGFGGRTVVRYLLLNVLVAVCSTAIAAPIIVSLGGHTGHGSDVIFDSIRETGRSLWSSVVEGNLLTSLADKVLSGLVALALVAALPLALRGRFPLARALGDLSHRVSERTS